MPSHAHHRSRLVGTAVAAGAHAYLAVLGILGFLNYTVPTKYSLLDEIASDGLWAWIHGIIAVMLVYAMIYPYRRIRWRPEATYMPIDAPLAGVVCSLGFAAMLVWAFFNFMWGLTTIRPVSLAGPGLAFVVAAGEQLLAYAWNRGALTRDR